MYHFAAWAQPWTWTGERRDDVAPSVGSVVEDQPDRWSEQTQLLLPAGGDITAGHNACEVESRCVDEGWISVCFSLDVQIMYLMLEHCWIHMNLWHWLSVDPQVVQAGNLCPQSDALQFLPLYIMGMLKSAAFRATNDISADLRTYIWMRLETMSVSQSAAFFNPRLMALHNSPEECRMPNDHGQIQLPEMLNLTSESMTQDGVYLLEDGESMYMWIGRAVDSNFLQAVFGMGSFDQLDVLAAESVVGTRNDPLSETGRIKSSIQFSFSAIVGIDDDDDDYDYYCYCHYYYHRYHSFYQGSYYMFWMTFELYNHLILCSGRCFCIFFCF